MVTSILAFVWAVLGGYVFAVLTYSQLNLNRLVDLGVALALGDRLTTAFHDLLGMPVYLFVIAVALLIAFAIAGLVIRWVPHLRTLGFVLAGAMGMFAMIMFFKVFMGTNPIAVTRTLTGLVSQCAAGALAGFIFVVASRARSKKA